MRDRASVSGEVAREVQDEGIRRCGNQRRREPGSGATARDPEVWAEFSSLSRSWSEAIRAFRRSEHSPDRGDGSEQEDPVRGAGWPELERRSHPEDGREVALGMSTRNPAQSPVLGSGWALPLFITRDNRYFAGFMMFLIAAVLYLTSN